MNIDIDILFITKHIYNKKLHLLGDFQKGLADRLGMEATLSTRNSRRNAHSPYQV